MTTLNHHKRQSRVIATVTVGKTTYDVRNEKVRKCYGNYKKVKPVWGADFRKVGEQILIKRGS